MFRAEQKVAVPGPNIARVRLANLLGEPSALSTRVGQMHSKVYGLIATPLRPTSQSIETLSHDDWCFCV